jgi:riboflavin kinase/FMN adenylyltransferase
MIGEKVYPSVSFIGKRVSSDGAFAVETHLLDMVMREEVKTLRLVFVAYLRENRKFETLRDLKVQISLDIQAAKIKLA